MTTTKTLGILLCLSLLFNLFVLLGVAQARRSQAQPPSDETVIKQVASELQLSDDQSKFFRDLRASTRKQTGELNEALMLVRHRMNIELRQDSPNLDLVQTLLDREAELIRQRRHVGADSFARFFERLTPQQRHAMAQRFDRPAPPPRHGPGREGDKLGARGVGSVGGVPQFLLKRHDRNGNGVLDPEELDAAIERGFEGGRRGDVKPLRRPRSQNEAGGAPLPQPWRRFDVDHNNVLDADELLKMDEIRRERARENQANQQPPQS